MFHTSFAVPLNSGICPRRPSVLCFKGMGRKFDLQEHTRLAESLIYIICDITQFPEVQVIFKTGTDLLQTYPRGKIPFRCCDTLFKGDQS